MSSNIYFPGVFLKSNREIIQTSLNYRDPSNIHKKFMYPELWFGWKFVFQIATDG